MKFFSMMFILLLSFVLMEIVSAVPISSPSEDILEDLVGSVVRRDTGGSCFDVDSGTPGNMHWNDLDQFVVVDNHKCRPALELRDGSCHHHMDLSTKCTTFCQTSAFYFFAEPIPIMAGKMCRAGERCEVKHEKSFNVEISNNEVERHVTDTTASLTPSASAGLGIDWTSIPTAKTYGWGGNRNYEKSTPSQHRRSVDGTNDMQGQASNGSQSEYVDLARTQPGAPGAFRQNAEAGRNPIPPPPGTSRHEINRGKHYEAVSDASLPISIPIPALQNPTATIAATIAWHWTKDWTRTYQHSLNRAVFTSITHKQVPGEGCGAFWAVPIGIAYCGWATSPRFPPEHQEAIMDWLAKTDNPYEGSVRLGSWGDPDKKHKYPTQMWGLTSGRCPVNFYEYPYCHATPLTRPGGHGDKDQALQRTVWRPYDCETGTILPSSEQPREVREHIDFNEFFKYHVRRDPRLFNPWLSWNPSGHQQDDHLFSPEYDDEYTDESSNANYGAGYADDDDEDDF